MRTWTLCSALVLALSAASLLHSQTFAAASFSSSFTAPLPSAPHDIAEVASFEEVPGIHPAIMAGVTTPSAPCAMGTIETGSSLETGTAPARQPCPDAPTLYKRFLDTPVPTSLTIAQKAHLALHNIKDPGNLVTIVGTAAFTVGTNAYTAYGPGWKGFGKNTGYSLLQDATGEFFGTFLIPTLTHEDPHYHRMPHASVPRRFVHALAHTVIAQHDDGSSMPNYSTLLTNPICAEISNLYIPGIHGNGPSTVARIMTGFATTPVDTEITEFLPDLARHIHIQVIFVQRILNPVMSDEYSLP